MRDIVTVVGRYLPLEGVADGNYRACCPFHAERTSSLMVFPRGNAGSAWGAGRAGT
jgi:DNA primase